MSAEARAREAICAVGVSLFARGLVHSSAGNLSVRLADGYLITPTDACLGRLDPAQLARLDTEGRQISGAPASKTLTLHRRIYDSEPAARAVLHSHSHALVRLSLQGVWRPDAVLPPITAYQVMKLGRVPQMSWAVPGAPGVADQVSAAIEAAQAAGRRLRAVLLERLGPVVWAADPEAASALLEELEETARLWLACAPQPAPLDAAQLAALEQRFGSRW